MGPLSRRRWRRMYTPLQGNREEVTSRRAFAPETGSCLNTRVAVTVASATGVVAAKGEGAAERGGGYG